MAVDKYVCFCKSTLTVLMGNEVCVFDTELLSPQVFELLF